MTSFPTVILASCLLGLSSLLQAQILSVAPAFPSTDDSVTIVYNAKLGDGGLAGYTSDVYAHTGVITTASQHPSDWKHVVASWGTADPKVLMESLGGDLYRIRFHIRSFYGIAPDEQVLSLAFVFRNASGSLSGRDVNGSDIFYPINRLPLGDMISYTFDGSVLTVHAVNGSLRLRLYDQYIARVEQVADSSVFTDTSFSVVLPPQPVSSVLAAGNDYLKLSGPGLSVLIRKNPVRLAFLIGSDTLLQDGNGLFSTFGAGGVHFALTSEEKLYGTGSRALAINRRGFKFNSYNTAVYGYESGASTLNISIPFLMSSQGYGLYIDNCSPGTWDLAHSDSNFMSYSAETGALKYFLIGGPSFSEILERYTSLTGRQPLPPRWALGYFQSRYGYQNETEARTTVQQLRTAQFPLDALVLDLYWFGLPYNMGNLTWDVSRFPTAADMISDFDSMGVKTILITEPYITKSSINYSTVSSQGLLATKSSGQPYLLGNFWAGEAGLLDVFRPQAQDWFWNAYQARAQEGVGGWWCDLGEPELHPSDMLHSPGPARSVHNVYSLIWAEMLYNRYRNHFPQQRLFNLIRSGYAGMQRHSTFPWSGDVRRSWSGLQAQIPIMLGMSLSGVAYMHSDIGGFTGGPQNEELYVRWQQLGAFSPIMRAHGEGVPTEPTAYSASAQNIVRQYIQLRYQLTPYNYSLAYENSLTGLPLARPLNFYEPNNALLADVNDSFLWGKDLLVAPVLQQGATSRTVQFPSGTWLRWDAPALSYAGGSTATVSAPLNALPLFVRAGSLIPMVPQLYSLKHYNTDTLIVRYFPNLCCTATSATVYDDDGNDPLAISDNAYERITFESQVNEEIMAVQLGLSGDFPGSPATRLIEFQIYRVISSPDWAWLDNQNIPQYFSYADFIQADTGWWYDAASQMVYTRLLWDGTTVTITWFGATLTGQPQTLQAGSAMRAFPNPFRDAVFITAPPTAEPLHIYSLDGRWVRMLPPRGSAELWSWDGTDQRGQRLPQGMYLAVVRSGMHLYRQLLVLH